MDKFSRPFADDVNLVESLYSIIDSKIQYAEFNMKTSIANFDKLGTEHPTTSQTQSDIILFLGSISESKDKLMGCIEHHSHKINLLLFIRKYLEQHNANAVLDLVTEDTFLMYDKSTLEQQLKKEKAQDAPDSEGQEAPSARDSNTNTSASKGA